MPLITATGGGSVRGLGRGLKKGGLPPGIIRVVSGTTDTTNGFPVYYTSNNLAGGESLEFDVTPGGLFYIAMIGASGGSGKSTYRGGAGGIGVATVIVPAGATRMRAYAGSGGYYGNTFNRVSGGPLNGGNTGSSGVAGSSFAVSNGSGGGLVALFSDTSGTIHANVVAAVGSGGGAGGASIFFGGSGGGFNQNGLDGLPTNDPARGGTLSAGGLRSDPPSRSYTSRNNTSGDELMGGKGSDSDYDAGAGGGAGYYGGAGGFGGGGFDGGAGGGGSGYLRPDGTVLFTQAYEFNDWGTVKTWVGNNLFVTLIGDNAHGSPPSTGQSNGRSGKVAVWNAP